MGKKGGFFKGNGGPMTSSTASGYERKIRRKNDIRKRGKGGLLRKIGVKDFHHDQAEGGRIFRGGSQVSRSPPETQVTGRGKQANRKKSDTRKKQSIYDRPVSPPTDR